MTIFKPKLNMIAYFKNINHNLQGPSYMKDQILLDIQHKIVIRKNFF